MKKYENVLVCTTQGSRASVDKDYVLLNCVLLTPNASTN